MREVLVEFNARIVAARRQLMGGPPVVTPLRDVEREVSAWRADARAEAGAAGRPDPQAFLVALSVGYSRSSSAGRIVVGMANASAIRAMPPTKSQAPQL